MSFGTLVARPRVYRIEDLRRFSESFVRAPADSPGRSAPPLSVLRGSQDRGWPPATETRRKPGTRRVDARCLACLREHEANARARLHGTCVCIPSACFWNARTASALRQSARGGTWSDRVPTSIPDLVRVRPSARDGPISSTSAARVRHAAAQSGCGEGVVMIGLGLYAHQVVIS